MENDNETVAEIREDVSEYLTSIGTSEYPSETQFEEFASRFEAAHERALAAKDAEIAELRECLQEALWQRCTIRPTFKCKDCAYEEQSCSKWRKALEGATNG